MTVENVHSIDDAKALHLLRNGCTLARNQYVAVLAYLCHELGIMFSHSLNEDVAKEMLINDLLRQAIDAKEQWDDAEEELERLESAIKKTTNSDSR